MAGSLADLGQGLAFSSTLQLETKINPKVWTVCYSTTTDYGPSNFKFVRVDAARDKLVIGHFHPMRGPTIDHTYARTFSDTSTHSLQLSFSGASVTVSVNGATLGTQGINSALVKGYFTLFAFSGVMKFDSVPVTTNDPAFATSKRLASGQPDACSLVTGAGAGSTTLAQVQPQLLQDTLAATIAIWGNPRLPTRPGTPSCGGSMSGWPIWEARSWSAPAAPPSPSTVRPPVMAGSSIPLPPPGRSSCSHRKVASPQRWAAPPMVRSICPPCSITSSATCSTFPTNTPPRAIP